MQALLCVSCGRPLRGVVGHNKQGVVTSVICTNIRCTGPLVHSTSIGAIEMPQNNCKRGYGLGKFFIDATLTCLTGGFWLIYVFVRESRRNNR